MVLINNAVPVKAASSLGYGAGAPAGCRGRGNESQELFKALELGTWTRYLVPYFGGRFRAVFHGSLVFVLWVMASVVRSEVPVFVLPTDNHALLDGKAEDFYQFVDRATKGETLHVWEGGQFGFVRDPIMLKTGEHIFKRFHEGLDIKPLNRDAKGEPLDEVRSIAKGEVVHCSVDPRRSNYGSYIVVKHDWGEGPFCSLYAHLSKVLCKEGDQVEPGAPLAIMGHTGAGIDQRRSHVHLELCLLLSTRFAAWHDTSTASLNYHGMWNGLNLIGLDVSQLFLKRKDDPNASIIDLVKSAEPHFRVSVPGTAEMELVENYPWLVTGEVPKEKPRTWEVTFTAWGLPTKIEASAEAPTGLTLKWVKPGTIPQFSLTRGLLAGTSEKASITNDGTSFLNLATGTFSVKPKSATPVVKKKK